MATDAALPQPWLDAAGAGPVAAGALAVALRGGVFGAGGTRAPQDSAAAAGSAARIAARVDPPFLALRDTLGAAWALRIAERFDAVAAERGWPCRLRFAGLDAGGDPADDSWHRDALRAFKALLRRFVDDAWLSRHGWDEPAP